MLLINGCSISRMMEGGVNDESVVFVSSKHMKVFIVNGVKETEPPY